MNRNLSDLGYNRDVQVPEMADLSFEQAVHVPSADTNYAPDTRVAGHILRWWFAARRNKSLFLVGPTGCGKTSLVAHLCHELNAPLYTVQVNATMRAEDAEGGMVLDNGETRFNPSDIIVAYRDGGVLLLDEGNRADPSLATWLNAITEYRPITIFATGEVVHPHPDFRLIMTGNAKAAGDMTGAYIDSNSFCVSFANRFRTIEFDYPDEDTEKAIIEAYGPNLSRELRANVLKASRHLTGLSESGDRQGRQISVPWTIRSVTDWVDAMNAEYSDRPIRESFDLTYTNALSEDAETEAVDDVLDLVFGREQTCRTPEELAVGVTKPASKANGPSARRAISADLDLTYLRHPDRNGGGPAYWIVVVGSDPQSQEGLYMAFYGKEGEMPRFTGKQMAMLSRASDLRDRKVIEKQDKGYVIHSEHEMPADLAQRITELFADSSNFQSI